MIDKIVEKLEKELSITKDATIKKLLEHKLKVIKGNKTVTK